MYKGVYSNSNGNIEGTKTSFRDETLIQLISSIRELASSFCSNSEEVRKEVTSMSGTSEPRQKIFFFTFAWAFENLDIFGQTLNLDQKILKL